MYSATIDLVSSKMADPLADLCRLGEVCPQAVCSVAINVIGTACSALLIGHDSFD